MTSHEIARRLLELPDKNLCINFYGWSISADTIGEFEKDITIFSDPRKDYGLAVIQRDRCKFLVEMEYNPAHGIEA